MEASKQEKQEKRDAAMLGFAILGTILCVLGLAIYQLFQIGKDIVSYVFGL
jgi:hypothetical protein